MNNANKPINPLQHDGWPKHESVLSENTLSGLTKLEYFAGLAMQGLLSSDAKYGGRTDNREALAKDAIAFATELLKQLDESK